MNILTRSDERKMVDNEAEEVEKAAPVNHIETLYIITKEHFEEALNVPTVEDIQVPIYMLASNISSFTLSMHGSFPLLRFLMALLITPCEDTIIR